MQEFITDMRAMTRLLNEETEALHKMDTEVVTRMDGQKKQYAKKMAQHLKNVQDNNLKPGHDPEFREALTHFRDAISENRKALNMAQGAVQGVLGSFVNAIRECQAEQTPPGQKENLNAVTLDKSL